MPTRADFLANLWRWKCGLPEKDLYAKEVFPSLEEVYKIQWVPEFEKLMRNRMAMGYFRYKPLNKQGKGEFKNMESAERRLNLWKETGNDELLVDIANLCMIEYLKGVHPKKHFKSVDDGEHVGKQNDRVYVIEPGPLPEEFWGNVKESGGKWSVKQNPVRDLKCGVRMLLGEEENPNGYELKEGFKIDLDKGPTKITRKKRK